MSLSPGWLQQLKQEWVIPEITPERCVHSHCEVASCTRCVDACPRNAWILDDASLHIDTGRCDGCGLCVAACTESALGQTLLPALRLLEDRKTLLFACEITVEGFNSEGVVPCLHAVNSSLLLEHYRAGYQQVLSCRGRCETCLRYGGRDLFREQLARLNKLLASRAAPTIRHAQVTLDEWVQHRNTPSATFAQTGKPIASEIAARREFLQRAIQFVVEEMEQAEGISPEAAPLPWANRLPAAALGRQALLPFVPELNKASCNGCDACVQLCPHQALQLAKQENGQVTAYRIQAEHCTGCGICEDVCDSEAIIIRQMKYVGNNSESIPLIQANCKACGSRFHYPVDGNAVQQYCRICAHTNHHRQLFQVY